jgi:hypothetical protein
VTEPSTSDPPPYEMDFLSRINMAVAGRICHGARHLQIATTDPTVFLGPEQR